MADGNGACPINIDAAGQRQRRIIGYAMLAGAAGFYVAATRLDLAHAHRAWVGIPVFVGALGLLQSRAKT